MLRIARCRLAYYFYFLCPRAPSIATPLTLSHPPLPTTPSLSTPTHPTPARVPRCFTHSPNLHTLCGAPTNPLTLHCPQPPHSPLPLPPRCLTIHSYSPHALAPLHTPQTFLSAPPCPCRHLSLRTPLSLLLPLRSLAPPTPSPALLFPPPLHSLPPQ